MSKKYAIIQLLGKQHRVSVGDTLVVDRLSEEEGKLFDVSDVLLIADGDEIKIGTPLVEKVKVTLKLVSNQKGKKLRVATYKAKSRSRKVLGHRSHQSTVEVVAIK